MRLLLSWGFPGQQSPPSWLGALLQGSQSLLTESWCATVSVGSSKEGICDKACMLLPQRKTTLWGPELLSPTSCRCPLGFLRDALFKKKKKKMPCLGSTLAM